MEGVVINEKILNDYLPEEKKLFKKMNSPKKIQDFLDIIKINFEEKGETCRSPRVVLKNGLAHCMEAALLAAAILEYHGAKPLVLDLRAAKHDFDHVVAPFKRFGFWGAISKTNHAVLRYREPIYRTIRELALSYFHEYFNDDGEKTLREHSGLLDLRYFNKINWRTSPENLFEIPTYLDKIRHYKILSLKQQKNLRRADKIEIQAGEIVEWKK